MSSWHFGSCLTGANAKSKQISLVFIDDVAADRSSKMNSQVCRAVLSVHTAKCCFTEQMNNKPKPTVTETMNLLKAMKMITAKSVT